MKTKRNFEENEVHPGLDTGRRINFIRLIRAIRGQNSLPQ